MKININFFKLNDLIIICTNFDCEFSFVNRQCLIVQRSNYVVHVLRKSKFLKINEINAVFLFINEYISLNFVIFNNLNDKAVKICFIKHFYIVNNFKINILLNNNIFELKNMFVHVDKKNFFVDNCDNFVASLKIIIKNNNNERVKRIIRFQINIVMSTHLYTIVFIKYREFKLLNRNLIFNFNDVKRLNKKNNVFFYIVDVNFFLFK